MAFTSEELALLQKTADALKYMPFVYREVILTDNPNPSYHYIKHKIGKLDPNVVLFFIPTGYDFGNNGENLQFIRLLQPGEGFNVASPNNVTYKVMIENTTTNGETVITQAKAFHLKPQKLYLMRMFSADEVIIINYNYDDVVLATRLEAGEAYFNTVPKVIIDDEEISLVKSDELSALAARVTALENLIKVNTQSPEEALQNENEGTIYFKVDQYGSSED